MKKLIILFVVVALLALSAAAIYKNSVHRLGEEVDSFNGVSVYYNGSVGNVSGRNLTSDNYNLGLKYQCVEFIKRYYFEHLDHKMPNSYGHAKDFFNPSLTDGAVNGERNLLQYTNPSEEKPEVNDIVVFKGTACNKFGHVAIVSEVGEKEIEIIQQNPGPMGKSREWISLEHSKGKWKLRDQHLVGWLRMR